MWVITKSLVFAGLFLFLGYSQAFAMLLAPENIDISLSQGFSFSFEILIENSSEFSNNYSIKVLDASVDSDSQDIVFLSTKIGAQWIVPEVTNVSLAPKENRSLLVNINVPSDLRPGSYVFGIQALEEAGNPTNISVNYGAVSLLFLTVEGKMETHADISNFSATKEFFAHLPIEFSATIENDGQRMSQPSGAITIRNLFGSIVNVLTFNESSQRILPGQTRTLSVLWGNNDYEEGFLQEILEEMKHFTIGIFKIESVILPFEDTSVSPPPFWIVVFPWRLALVLGFLTSLALAVFFFARSRIWR
ncbi:MAG: hypothetical protein WC730_00680 [Patescibacteria group bacterium]|jgi:hypothetical protein